MPKPLSASEVFRVQPSELTGRPCLLRPCVLAAAVGDPTAKVARMAAGTRIAPSVQTAPSRLVETSADVRAAVLADPAGGLIAASAELDIDEAHRFAGLAADLFGAADGALGDPAQQVEAQVEGGAAFAVRDSTYTLACVTSRPTLPALVLYDLQQTLEQIERET